MKFTTDDKLFLTVALCSIMGMGVIKWIETAPMPKEHERVLIIEYPADFEIHSNNIIN